MRDPDRNDEKNTSILLTRGDVESLVCTLIAEQESTSRLRLLHLKRDGANAGQRERSARLQAELMEQDLEIMPPNNHLPPMAQELGLALQAVEGSGVVIWPLRCGPDATAVAEGLELARHMSHAWSLSTRQEPISILTPIIDLDECQVLELALDLNGPLGASWPCEEGGAAPCGDCEGCQPWRSAAEKLAQEWPLGALQPS